MRREWRRTSSSQAEPSPWRHCWTSWASCSNVSSASNPGAVTCAATPGQFLVNRGQPISACHSMERKVPSKCSLGHHPGGRKQSPHLTHHVSERQANPCSGRGSAVASPFLVQRNSRVNGGAFPLPTIRLETFGLVLPEVEITITEPAKKSRKNLGQCHPKEIEFRTRAINGFRLASSLKAMPQQSNTS
jgi:hypothetical protein